MKIYLASFLEPQNFGPGRKLAIANPVNYRGEIDGSLRFLAPKDDLLEGYKSLQYANKQLAAEMFISGYNEQLDYLFQDLQKTTKQEGLDPDNFADIRSLMDLQEGDTLLSRERYAYTNYRSIVGEFLTKLGYEVVLR